MVQSKPHPGNQGEHPFFHPKEIRDGVTMACPLFAGRLFVFSKGTISTKKQEL
jgi:hypothetical protein